MLRFPYSEDVQFTPEPRGFRPRDAANTRYSDWLLAYFFVAVLLVVFSGCATYHARQVQGGLTGDRLTLGTVQREIRKGMSGGEVIAALGSPNVVSTDEQGREVWVYDKFATDVVTSDSGWNVLGIGGTAGSSGAGAGLLGARGGSGASSTSQRTLTIVIKFDEKKQVRDFAYHASRF